MAFAFYLPNLAVAQLFIRARRISAGSAERVGAAVVMLAATAFVSVAAFVSTTRYRDPVMVSGVTRAPL